MFFFKKKSLTIDCFTAVDSAFRFAKPKHSAELLPEWWKELPKAYTPKNSFCSRPTMRTCSGFIDLYKRGIMLPAWCDVAIKIGAKGTEEHRWQFSDQNYNAETHDYEQIGAHFNGKEFAHLKFVSPWLLKCNESVNWLWQDPTWNTLPNYDYKILPAAIDFKRQHGTHVNMIFRRKEEAYTHQIQYKTPLVQLIPLSDNRKIKLKYHQVSDKEIVSLNISRLKFTNSYQENIKRSKCPYG